MYIIQLTKRDVASRTEKCPNSTGAYFLLCDDQIE